MAGLPPQMFSQGSHPLVIIFLLKAVFPTGMELRRVRALLCLPYHHVPSSGQHLQAHIQGVWHPVGGN